MHLRIFTNDVYCISTSLPGTLLSLQLVIWISYHSVLITIQYKYVTEISSHHVVYVALSQNIMVRNEIVSAMTWWSSSTIRYSRYVCLINIHAKGIAFSGWHPTFVSIWYSQLIESSSSSSLIFPSYFSSLFWWYWQTCSESQVLSVWYIVKHMCTWSKNECPMLSVSVFTHF